MLTRIRLVLQEVLQHPVDDVDDETALQMAFAVLMFEVLRADHEIQPQELAQLRQHLSSAFELTDSQLEDLVEVARARSEHAVSLHEFTRTINETCSMEDKRRLITMLWDVAYADGVLHHYEEYAIRKLADLLYIPHRDFIQAKHDAMPG